MSTEAQINKIVSTIEDAVKRFEAEIPGIQSNIAKEIELLLKGLDLKGDNVANTLKNLKSISRIQNRLNAIVLNPEYIDAVKQLTASFNEVAKLQNDYFGSVSDKFKPSALLEEIKSQSIKSVVGYLTEDGIRANIGNKLTDILRISVTTGASYADLRTQLGDFLKTNESGIGALQRYTSQLVTDALNQFSASYSQTVTQSLGFKWHVYTGSLLTTSREFCIHMVKKKYVYDLELPELLQGNIDGTQIHINAKTDLPDGMNKETTVENFPILRGGFNCQHSYTPVAENFVPLNIRIAKYNKFGIEHENGKAV